MGSKKVNKLPLRPIHDRVLVRRIEAEKKSGLIHIPEKAQEKPSVGEVIFMGAECGDEFHVGNRVLFGKFAGAEVTVDGEEMLLLKEDAILAVVEDL